MPLYGLIGKSLKHSFSKNFFTEKFTELHLSNHRYELFELQHIEQVLDLMKNTDLKGLNVTIPYKESIVPLLDEVESTAKAIGAVNTVKITDEGRTIGYNTDYYGFKASLQGFIPNTDVKALIFGSGGASKAVAKVLTDMGIPYVVVSRQKKYPFLSYEQLTNEVVNEHRLLINCTPVGTFPNIDEMLPIPFDAITSRHYGYDLIYNPEKTEFLQLAEQKGATIKNGLDMLIVQAEQSWKIWNR